MAQIGQGDYSTRFEPDPLGFEINELGDNLNRMVSALLQQMESAKEERVKKETLANELTIGRSIQLSILPQEMPQLPSLDIAARALPAKEVGGDFYDIFTKGETGKREVILSIADAAGKGISACLYSLCLRSMLRSYEALSDDVGLIVQQANNLFAKDTEQTSMFVTAFVAVYDEGSGRLNYFSCGHPPTLLLRKDGSIEKLWTEGMAMGVQDFEPIKQASCTLQRGDLLCLYTDGVTEAHNPKNELFGEKRLEEFLIAHRDKPANQVCDDLLAAIENFAEGAAQHDDITMVVMKVL